MKKIITIVLVGMIASICFASVVPADSEEREFSNRAPNAPIFVYEKCSLKKDCYSYCLFSDDPDYDEIYYEVSWEKIENADFLICSSDEPKVQLYGPYNSGEEFQKNYVLPSFGTYELSVRARDIYNNIGPSSTLTVTYKDSSMLQRPVMRFLQNYFPELFEFVSEIL